MNERGANLLVTAAAFRGELQKMLLALGIVLLILISVWLIEEWRMRKFGAAMGWVGFSCLGVFGLCAAALITVGLL
ncbi:hypothetical protein ABIE88_008520 [Bradyrhizobium diazoefficiens]|uniref:hypothetical protein n=1 Tax=Bradyrhizobium TaxID=374 RepID=UPI003182EF93